MSVSPIFQITEPTPTQNNKEVTVGTAIDRLEAISHGFLSIAITGGYTLTTAPADTCEALNAKAYKFTGTLSGAANIIVPDLTREFIVWNATTGGFAITVKTSAGTGVTVGSGDVVICYCDGTNVIAVAGGIGGTITLKVNGVDNIDQSILDLIDGTGITITDNGDGTVTIDCTVSGLTVAGASGDLQTNNGSGGLGSVAQSTFVPATRTVNGHALSATLLFQKAMWA